MLEITFEQPMSFHMEVVESDDRVPSMRVETKIVVLQFQHTVTYQGAFWIECSNWSRFTDALNNPLAHCAELQDISGYFTLKICNEGGKRVLSWDLRKFDLGAPRQTSVTFSAEIDDEMLGRIKNEFSEFPMWW